jgi:hypothetical protein
MPVISRKHWRSCIADFHRTVHRTDRCRSSVPLQHRLQAMQIPKLLQILIAIPLLAILIPLAVCALLCWLIYGFVIYLLVWVCWCTRGRRVLLLYSNSPAWQDYIDENIIPRLPENTIILNWSERKQWKRSHPFSSRVCSYFGGEREFNPMVLVFRPLHKTEVFRFWQPFRDYKHGNPATLKETERQLFISLRDR